MAIKRKASGRKSFTAETKAEALRLIREAGYTAKQAAEHIGCSVQAIQQWKAAAQSGKMKTAAKNEVTAGPAKKIKRRRRKGIAKKTVTTASAENLSISFDEFVQDYWSEYPAATDIMRLPPDLMPTAVQYVNNVLRYAHDRFCGR